MVALTVYLEDVEAGGGCFTVWKGVSSLPQSAFACDAWICSEKMA